MMLPTLYELRKLFGKVRIFRRVLGWHQGLKLAWAAQRQQRRISVSLPHFEQPIELRLNHSDAKVFEKIWIDREYTLPFPIEARFIVDAGANVGLSSLFFASVYPDAEIIALEPEEKNFALLKKNCAGVSHIHPFRGALWGRSTDLRIVDPNAESWAFHLCESAMEVSGQKSEAIPAITIPEILREHGRKTIDVLKIDIEGGEQQLFTPECLAWLPHVRLIIIELHDRYQPGCSRAFYSQLVKFPFAQEQRGENLFILLDMKSSPSA